MLTARPLKQGMMVCGRAVEDVHCRLQTAVANSTYRGRTTQTATVDCPVKTTVDVSTERGHHNGDQSKSCAHVVFEVPARKYNLAIRGAVAIV